MGQKESKVASSSSSEPTAATFEKEVNDKQDISRNGKFSSRENIQERPKLKKRISFYETIDASEVLPYLIIGNLASSKNENFLSRKNVKFILNLTSDSDEIEGIEYKTVPLEDDDDQLLAPYFESCFEFINTAAQSRNSTGGTKKEKDEPIKPTVLVHSYFGMSRSSAIIIAYLMKEKKWSLREAYDHLKERHSSINPNDNFIVQLIHYEQELYDGRMSMTIKDFHH